MPKPKTNQPPNAALYPEGGPGRQLKARLKAGEVLVGGILGEIVRPSLVKCYQQACSLVLPIWPTRCLRHGIAGCRS